MNDDAPTPKGLPEPIPEYPEMSASEPVEVHAPEPPPERRTVEAWREALEVNVHVFAGMRVGERWPVGAELTEAEFRAALDRFHNIVVR